MSFTSSLESLGQYGDEQASIINKLIEGGALIDTVGHVKAWDKFRDSLWGKGLQHLQVPPTDDARSVVQGTDETLRPVVRVPEELPPPLFFYSRKVLERSEYQEAEQEILLANKDGRQAFMVSGNPGIGKTIFLVWLLMRRLALGLPTVLQVEPQYALFFHRGGTSQLSTLEEHIAYWPLYFGTDVCKRVWALVDSNDSLEKPAPIFRYGRPFFVVETLSPRPTRFEWTTKVAWRYFFMKTWTLSEVRQARMFLVLDDGKGPLEDDEVTGLYEIYHASPRDLVNSGHDPDTLHDLIDLQVQQMDLAAIKIALASPDIDNSSDYVTRIEPSYRTRAVPRKTISCRFAFQLLWDRYIKDQTSEREFFYQLFSNNPIAGSAAGWVLEFRMHQLLREGRTINLFPIGGHPTINTIYDHYPPSYDVGAKALVLPESEEHSLQPMMALTIGRYYRPLNPNFPTIDSLFLVKPPCEPSPILLMFQVTQNKDSHDVNRRGLAAVEGLGLPPNTRKWLVVVTPFNIEPKIVVPPKTAAPNTDRMDVDEVLQVFNCPVKTQMLFLTPQLGFAPGT